MATVLTVDVGGTKSRIGLYSLNGGNSPAVQAVYKNRDFKAVDEVVAVFLSDYDVEADYGCLAIAGVVDGDTAVLTNLAWTVHKHRLADRFSLKKVVLLNDLTALSMSIPWLTGDDLFTIKEGKRSDDETIAVIAPGTGLGQGYLVPCKDGHIVRGSEGGHSGFAPANELELDILRWMIKGGSELSAEHVGAGPGIGNLYRYFLECGDGEPSEWVKQLVAQSGDITPAVVRGATAENKCPVCEQVIASYLHILGRESANLALKLYAKGGVYVGGGVLLHLVGKVSLQPFIDGFLTKNKVSELIESIPVYGIQKEDALLLGAYKHIVGYAWIS